MEEAQRSRAVHPAEIQRIAECDESRPETILGPHLLSSGQEKFLSIRAFLPRATKVWANMENGPKIELALLDNRGFWEAQIQVSELPKYTISYEDKSGFVETREDPYSFSSLLSDYDVYLIGEGTDRRIFEKLGAHLKTINGIPGVHFAVWAPNAKSISLVGNFNHWQVCENPMTVRGTSGIWELFVPRIRDSEVYKYAIKSNADGQIRLKTDPCAFKSEVRPRTAAIVADLDSYHWDDENWISERRMQFRLDERPISVYEVHLGSWRKREDGTYLNYREIADELVPYAKELGFSHIELLPIMEHPLDDSWGYQIVNYYAPTSRYGSPHDFMYFVDKCHQSGLGVILDWVPAHFPKDDYGLGMYDGTHLYEHADPRMGVHPDWDTLIFNYSRNEVRSFLVSNAVFWFEKYHVDGLRLDAVASMLYLDYSRKQGEWIPNKFGGRENLDALEFLRQTNEIVHSMFPNILTIAEESTAWPGVTHPVKKGGLGFDLKWNMGWMHDTLEYFQTDPIFRKHLQRNLTFSLIYAFSEKFILVFSHDEVVYGKRSLLNKMPGDEWKQFANLRLSIGYMFAHPGKKLLFMGSEFGQWSEWNFRTELSWQESSRKMNSQLSNFVKDVSALYNSLPALHDLDFSYDGFEWIDFKDSEQSVISFLRKPRNTSDRFVLVVCNMTPVIRYDYRVGVPKEGSYSEILNSDAAYYGGSDVGNLGNVKSERIPWHERPFSLNLTLPPLAIIMFEYGKP